MQQFIRFLIISCLWPVAAFAGYFDSTIENILKEQLNNEYLYFETKYDSPIKLNKIYQNEKEIESINLTFFSPVTKSFKVSISLPNSELIEIFGKYDTYYKVPVASRYIKSNEIITPGDITYIDVKKLKNTDNIAMRQENIIDMQIKKSVLANHYFKISDLKRPPVIKENDPVTIVYKSNNITLKTIGLAESAGAIGDKIKVKNDKTGIIVYGEIIDKNIVQVSNDEN